MSTSGTQSWRGLRDDLGRSVDRSGLVQFFSSVTGYVPLPHQLRAHLAHAPIAGGVTHKLMLGGIGSGKTLAGCAETAMLAIANAGANGAVLAPTFDQILHVVVPELRAMFDEMAARGYPLVRRWKHSTACFELIGGGRLFARSFDRVDSIRGFNLAYIHLDETSMARRPTYVFDTLVGRLRDRTANKLQIHITTTPRGLHGVVAKFVSMRQAADLLEATEAANVRRTWWVGRAPTQANTHLPAGYVESLRAGYSRRQWEQEVEAKLLKPETAVFSEFSRERHLRPWRYDATIGAYDLAIDWGHSHPSVLFIQRIPGTGEAVIFDEFCEDGVPRDHLRHYIRRACERLGRPPSNIAGDRAVKSENAWAMHTYPSAMLHTMKSRRHQAIVTGVELLRTMLDPVDRAPLLYIAEHLAKDPPPRGIVLCLENYRYKMRPDGSISDEIWKDNLSDHSIDALRYWTVGCGMNERKPYVVGRAHGRTNDPADWFSRRRARARF